MSPHDNHLATQVYGGIHNHGPGRSFQNNGLRSPYTGFPFFHVAFCFVSEYREQRIHSNDRRRYLSGPKDINYM